MITITRKKPEEFAREIVKEMPLADRLDLDLSRSYGGETIYFAGIRSGKAETLPLDSVWGREQKEPIDSIYTASHDSNYKKNRALRQVDRVLVHISPEEFSLERRVCYPGEVLSFGHHNENGKMPPSNGSHCVSENEQYQLVVTQKGNVMVRLVSQYDSNTNPKIKEISYLSATGNNDKTADYARVAYLTRVLETLPEFNKINLLTEKEHGREIRAVTPDCRRDLIYEALQSAGYDKKEDKNIIRA